jgi:hypothetical protein
MTSKDRDAYDYENALYAQVADEIETGKITKGLWAKAIATASGDKSTIEANYIKLRVQNIRDEENFLHESKIIEIKRKASERRIEVVDRILIISFIVLGIMIIFLLML